MRTWTAGSITVDRVVDLDGTPFDANDLYPDATRDAVRATLDRFGPAFIDPQTLGLRLSFHSFVVRTARHVILVDACIGNDKERPMRPPWHRRRDPFLERLAGIGVRPEDVDFVLCTHLHADHVGWNTRLVDGRWVPTFPNARYLVAAREFAHWKAQHEAAPPDAPVAYGSFADSVLPVARSGQMDLVGTGHEVVPGVNLEGAPGHTPGNVVVHVGEGGARAVMCGDVIHHPVQLLHPAWSTRFCFDPDRSRRTRVGLLETLAGTHTRLLPAHFRAPTAGCVTREGAAYGFAFDG